MRGWMILAASLLPFAALAQTGDAADTAAANGQVPAPPPGLGFGSQSRAWLAIQTSGEYAVTDERPMPGEVATLIYQRYLTSFTHPIPEHFGSDSFKTTGGSSSSP